MNRFPKNLILRTSVDDQIGIEIELDDTVNDYSYYVEVGKSSTRLVMLSRDRIKDVMNGTHGTLYCNIQALHNAVWKSMEEVMDSIRRFRMTGEYYDNETLTKETIK